MHAQDVKQSDTFSSLASHSSQWSTSAVCFSLLSLPPPSIHSQRQVSFAEKTLAPEGRTRKRQGKEEEGGRPTDEESD